MPSQIKSSFHLVTSPLIRSHDDTSLNRHVSDWLRHLSPPGCCGHVSCTRVWSRGPCNICEVGGCVCVCARVCKVALIVVCQPWVLPLPPSALCEQWGKTPRGLKYEKVLKRGKYLSAGLLSLAAQALFIFISLICDRGEKGRDFFCWREQACITAGLMLHACRTFEHHCCQWGVVAVDTETSDRWKLV